MHLIYYPHSYRPSDKDVNEFFQELMLSEGMTPSLDPPSDHLNAAKPERHLSSTDGMVAVLPHRDPEPSKYILFEIGLCARAQRPVLVFVEDVLPNNLISAALLQRRFSRRHLLREVRSHRHALRTLKTHIGTEPPPTHQPKPGQRACLVIGASSVSDAQRSRIEEQLASLHYHPLVVSGSADCLSYDHPYEGAVAQATVCVSFVERLSPLEFYLLGAARTSLLPSILLTQVPNYVFSTRVPTEYQPRKVSTRDMDALCHTVATEVGLFEEDYLELGDQERVLRYRSALITEGSEKGVYSHQVRDVIVNLVGATIGEIDMSKDKIEVSNVVGPVNIRSQLERVTQVVKNAPAMPDAKRQEFADIISQLQAALTPAAEQRPADAERVARTAELVASELAKDKPDKGFLSITVDGLKQAAKTVEDIAPSVLGVAARIAAFVAGVTS